MSILIGIFTLMLIFDSLFLILVVLAQKTKDGGMGSALGGGATESAFGHETGNVLTKATINAAVLFFVLSFLLYLAQIYESKHRNSGGGGLPEITAPAAVPVPPGPAAASDFKFPLTPTTSSATATAPAAAPTTAATTMPTVSLPPPSTSSTPPAAAADATKPADAPKSATP